MFYQYAIASGRGLDFCFVYLKDFFDRIGIELKVLLYRSRVSSTSLLSSSNAVTTSFGATSIINSLFINQF